MELKLIDAKPLSNELIDAFYKHIEEQEFTNSIAEEQKEELEYNESNTIITRRKFLQYSALGAIGLGLSLGTEVAQAGGDNYYRKQVTKSMPSFIRPKRVRVSQPYLRRYEPAKGEITILNQTDNYIENRMKLKLVSSRRLKQSGNAYADYEIPSFTENTYTFEDGPWGIARRNTRVNVCASNNHGRKRSQGLFLYA